MRFHSSPIEEHVEVPIADEGLLDQHIARWSERASRPFSHAGKSKGCYVVSVQRRGESDDRAARLDEIVGLIEAQGDAVVGQRIMRLAKANPRTLISRGVAEALGARARASGADLLVLDARLSPSQTRNLEDAVGLPVCDRDAVILQVFEQHAKTPRSRIQVELAHLEYLRPRIRGIGLDMDQQAGGLMGSRGPGETASELLARQLDGRLARLRRALLRIKHSDRARRARRSRCARVVLVGYTNAGKTSLMNALTGAGLSARSRPFETLDTTSRCLSRHGGDVLLSDTVGFIRRLPESLFASFESTLAEVAEASLLVIVVDRSDPEFERHLRITEGVLGKLGAAEVRRLYVFTKEDLLPQRASPEALSRHCDGHPFVSLSTRDAAAVASLERVLLREARSSKRVQEVFVPYASTEIVAQIYAQCRVLELVASERGTQFSIEGEAHVVAAIQRRCRAASRRRHR